MCKKIRILLILKIQNSLHKYVSRVHVAKKHRSRTDFQAFFMGLEGSWGQPQGPNFPSPGATMLALRLDCSTAAFTTPQKVLSI